MFFEALYFGHFLSFYTMQLEPPKSITTIHLGQQYTLTHFRTLRRVHRSG